MQLSSHAACQAHMHSNCLQDIKGLRTLRLAHFQHQHRAVSVVICACLSSDRFSLGLAR